MNEIWDAWVENGCEPVRACVKAELASPRDTCGNIGYRSGKIANWVSLKKAAGIIPRAFLI